MVDGPLEPFEDESNTLLKVQSAKVNAVYTICGQSSDHVDCELDAVVFHELVVMLCNDEVMHSARIVNTTNLDLAKVRKERGRYGGSAELCYSKEGRVGLYRHYPRDNWDGNSWTTFGQKSNQFLGRWN